MRRKEAEAGYADALTGSEACLNESGPKVGDLLPAHFYGSRRGSAAVEPLKRLMMAVLADAIRCFQRGVRAKTLSKRREFRDANDWLFAANNDGPFSFETVCYVLGTDFGLFRKRLIQSQHARAARVERAQTPRNRCTVQLDMARCLP
jgi:hypothetical protein